MDGTEIVLRRRLPSDGRVGFELPTLYQPRKDVVVAEIGLIAREAGRQVNNPNPARMHDVMFKRDDGTSGTRLGVVSVPAEIADDFARRLVVKGYGVVE